MKWDEGKQVKESIQQRAGTPQPQTTVSKRVIKKESLMSLIPRGWPKNTEANLPLRKQPQEEYYYHHPAYSLSHRSGIYNTGAVQTRNRESGGIHHTKWGRNIESLRLEKAFKIVESNHKPNMAKSTKEEMQTDINQFLQLILS